MKYHNYTPQTNPRHREEEPQNIYSNKNCDFRFSGDLMVWPHPLNVIQYDRSSYY